MKKLSLDLRAKFEFICGLPLFAQKMKLPEKPAKLLDYRKAKASNGFVPNPAVLASSGWESIHLELHQQPKFETIEHQHTMHVIAYGVSDSPGERSLDGKMQPERRCRGDIAIIPAGISHRCNWNNAAEFMVLAIEPALLQQVGYELFDGDRIELMPQLMSHQDPLIQGLILTLRNELESGQIGGELLVDSLKTSLAIHLLRQYCTTKPKFSHQTGLSPSKLQQVTEYIHEHLDRDLKIIELAAIAHLSPCYFVRLFKASTGTTPHQYLLQRRIEKAKYLLQHSESGIAEISATVGFCDQSHFTRYFKRITGVTPKELKAKSQ